MLSKKDIQYIRSLRIKKYRQKYHNYLAEGEKICVEILSQSSHSLSSLYCQESFYNKHSELLKVIEGKYDVISDKELKKITSLSTPGLALAVMKKKDEKTLSVSSFSAEKMVYLDDIRDPGNMGTIFRTAEWFGVDHILLSNNCVDPYNPKVIQSAMGSLLRMSFSTIDLSDFLENRSKGMTVYTADMDGGSIFSMEYKKPWVLVLGNESHGVGDKLKALSTQKIHIPGAGNSTESLNVAVAGAIILADIFKKG